MHLQYREHVYKIPTPKIIIVRKRLEKDMLPPLPNPQIKQPLYSCYLMNIISKKQKKKVYTNTNVHKCCFYYLNGIQQNSTAF